MATRCCHINMIVNHSMQNNALIERLSTLSAQFCIQIGSDKSSVEANRGSAKNKGCGVTEVGRAER